MRTYSSKDFRRTLNRAGTAVQTALHENIDEILARCQDDGHGLFTSEIVPGWMLYFRHPAPGEESSPGVPYDPNSVLLLFVAATNQ